MSVGENDYLMLNGFCDCATNKGVFITTSASNFKRFLLAGCIDCSLKLANTRCDSFGFLSSSSRQQTPNCCYIENEYTTGRRFLTIYHSMTAIQLCYDEKKRNIIFVVCLLSKVVRVNSTECMRAFLLFCYPL